MDNINRIKEELEGVTNEHEREMLRHYLMQEQADAEEYAYECAHPEKFYECSGPVQCADGTYQFSMLCDKQTKEGK